jgi:hypothetical protein
MQMTEKKLLQQQQKKDKENRRHIFNAFNWINAA